MKECNQKHNEIEANIIQCFNDMQNKKDDTTTGERIKSPKSKYNATAPRRKKGFLTGKTAKKWFGPDKTGRRYGWIYDVCKDPGWYDIVIGNYISAAERNERVKRIAEDPNDVPIYVKGLYEFAMVNDISNDKQQKVNASIYDGKQDTHHEKKRKANYFEDDDWSVMCDGKQGRDLWGEPFQYYGYSILEDDD